MSKKANRPMRRFFRKIRRAIRNNPRPPTDPETIHKRWRGITSSVLDAGHFSAVGLDNVWDRFPGKYDRQVIAATCLRNVCEQGLQGSVMEFGCYNGHTAIQLVQTLRSLEDMSPVLLLDSFEGMPESQHPLDLWWKPGRLKADYESCRARFEEFPRVEVLKGFFDATLEKLPEQRVKFAHIDCDMQKSVRDVHAWLLDRMVAGGVIVYDDYGFESCEGLMQAVDEDIAARPDYVGMSLPTGQYLALRTRELDPA